MEEAALKQEIKAAMVEELMLQQGAEEIGDESVLFSPEGLGLDSVDALQLVVALEKRFGLKVSDAEAAKGILQSVNTIAAAISTARAAVAEARA
jgi:acyl carrier protein